MMSAEHCTVCGKPFDAITGAVHVAGEGVFCDRCYNTRIARQLGIDPAHFRHGDLNPITVAGVDGTEHTFHIRSRLAGDGRVMDAIEVRDGAADGYELSVMGEVDADPLVLFAALYRRVLEALATRHVKESDLGWRITDGHRRAGRIEWDQDEDGRVPRLIVDGRPFTWEEIGRMLMSFEGCRVEMSFHDRIDDLRRHVPERPPGPGDE